MRPLGLLLRRDSRLSYSSWPHNVINAFYHADLLEISERPGMTIRAFWLIDDVNILAYRTSTERNIRAMERLHKQCENQARRYSSTFASTKYELICLARNSERLNVAAEITITEEAKAPEPVNRVLGVQIDTKEMGPIYRIRRNWCGRSQISQHPLKQHHLLEQGMYILWSCAQTSLMDQQCSKPRQAPETKGKSQRKKWPTYTRDSCGW